MKNSVEKVILLDPCFGISGDMFASAMIGLGAGTDYFFKTLRSFKAEEKYEIEFNDVKKSGFKAK